MMISNIIKLNQQDNASLYIKLFLEKKNNKSGITSDSYYRYIKAFFKDMSGVSEIEFVTDDMIKKLNVLVCQNYFQDMINDGLYSSATIAAKVTAVRNLFDHMIEDNLCDKDENRLLTFNPLRTFSVSVENNEYGAFSLEEALKIINLAKDENEELALYYSIMLQTGIRPEECKKLTLKSIKIINNIPVIEGTGKHHKDFSSAISMVLYDKCIELADEKGIIFHFGENYARNKLQLKTSCNKDGKIRSNYNKSYCARIGISEEECIDRNLVLHSFKKSIISEACKRGATIDELMELSHHSNVSTLVKYINKLKRNPANDASLKFIDFDDIESVEDRLRNKFESMSKEDIINMVMKLDTSCKLELLES